MDEKARIKTLKEQTIKAIIDAISEANKNNRFQMEKVFYDEEHFGNVIMILNSKEQIRVSIIRDRSEAECELESPTFPDKWIFLDDLLKILDLKPIGVFSGYPLNNFIQAIVNYLGTIQVDWPLIAQLFDTQHINDTYQKVDAIKKERIKTLYRLG
jgi:hypothetical protein